jgi:glutamine synthetase
MNPRFQAVQTASSRKPMNEVANIKSTSDLFGRHVFSRKVMQQALPREIYKNILNAMEGLEKIKPEYADTIAVAMKEWAISLGATHYTHWFQPLTGSPAEKHDSFIDWASPDEVIEKFSGKQLIQGEPDASSFPSGGLRSTYEARGYTGWDPTSHVFVWEGGDGLTLCIPSIFFSWTGDVLDTKIPLLRSDAKINEAVMRLLKITGIEADFIYSTLGCEQEYFVIDRAIRSLRPDLILTGRTMVGAPSPKGQELQDHYFASVKDRILSYMQDFEIAALKLGIPVKTRHNEVAPAQHEVAPVYEKSSMAVDHNLLLMELMRQIAAKHQLSCLLHEKPFHGLNGSGKHCNWSLSTNTNINLLDPTDSPGNNLHFLILLTAILNAVHTHSTLLRASIGSAANDFRLGGHEAPPAIISVYLGRELELILENIEQKVSYRKAKTKDLYDLGLPVMPDLTKDNTDRNRTSPFAFTGNKFEFRAVGSSANPAFPMTVLNAVIAESVNLMMDEIEANMDSKKTLTPEKLSEAAFPVIRKYLKASRNIRFSGDNYSEDWKKEASKRSLPNISKSYTAFEALKSNSTLKAFKDILNKHELNSLYEIALETYVNTLNIETKVMLDLYNTQILPIASKYQRELAENLVLIEKVLGKGEIQSEQKKRFRHLSELIEKSIKIASELENKRLQSYDLPVTKKAKAFSDQVVEKSEELRTILDQLEMMVDDALWPLPKYREILFLV